MEKQGMERRKRFLRTGLLTNGRGARPAALHPLLIIFSLFVFRGGFVFSQAAPGVSPDESSGEETAPLEVRIETSPSTPAVGSSWSVYVLVNHPVPSEVNVRPPRFPSPLVLERVRTEIRIIRREDAPAPSASGESGGPAETPPPGPASGDPSPPRNERWTRVEFLFTPQRTGDVSLDPFEVTVSGRAAKTGAVNVSFRDAVQSARRYNPRLRWLSVTPLRSGERGELFLELGGWDPQKKAPQGIFRGNLPLNAVLEENPPEPLKEGYLYRFNIIPLKEDDVSLGSFSFSAEGFTLAVPALTVSVLPPLSGETPPPRPAAGEPPPPLPDESGGTLSPPFPQSREKVFPFFRGNYLKITAGVKALWDSGRRAEALAEIRRNERDSLPGPWLAGLRGEMEQALGIDFTEDENWRPLKIPLSIWAIFALLVLSGGTALFVFRPRLDLFTRHITPGDNSVPQPADGSMEKNVTSARRKGFRTIIIITLSIGLALALLEEGLGNFLTGRLSLPENTAVLESTRAYRVPDPRGAVNALFDEGQPVTIGIFRGDWCYAESSDGRSGWVPREALVSY